MKKVIIKAKNTLWKEVSRYIESTKSRAAWRIVNENEQNRYSRRITLNSTEKRSQFTDTGK